MDSVTINGQTVELTEVDEDELVTEVIVLRRTIRIDENGKAQDSQYIDISSSCTSIVELGMLEAARHSTVKDWGFANMEEGDD